MASRQSLSLTSSGALPGANSTSSIAYQSGSVPAGNGTAYALFSTASFPNASVWRWSYQQYVSATNARTASAWGIFTKDATGTLASAELAGPLSVEQILPGGVATDAPATITYAANTLGLTTNGGNTAAGQAWQVTISPW